MISISILHNNLDHINGFIVDGHANYSSYGEDIVCASVSTTTIGTVNAIERFCHLKMQTEVRDGYLKAIIPIDRNDKKDSLSLIMIYNYYYRLWHIRFEI